jgi:hypothetical protein
MGCALPAFLRDLGSGHSDSPVGAVFLQPKNIKALLRNGLPAFSGFGASAEIFGQVLEVNATLDTKRDEQLDIINSRVDELERVLAGIAIPEATGEG